MVNATLGRLTATYLRVGNLTFGGGDPAMAALYSELVARRPWLTRQDYGLVYALARVTPGTNLLAFCAGTAWKLNGWLAAVLAVLAVTAPSACIVLLLTAGFEQWGENPTARAAIQGTLAAAVGMMIAGAWLLLRPQLTRLRGFRAVVVIAVAAVLPLISPMSPIQVIALAAIVGFFWRMPAAR